ncbi:MAG TPA: metalloregulator ArsR/SmtB family transcription factor [Pseudonocardiaceae bacterium]|nr:metalloregulator ArsR/SmtB family transcription factor [Pseudonocardiaceae bacterium]
METIELAEVAAVLADPSRATMCLALIDGRAWTVGELATAADIAPSTASAHVRRLADAGFVATVRQGRHHYVRLADQRVAELIERLAEHAAHRPPRTLRASLRARRLAYARTCYDHIAGRLGVALRDGMLRTGLVDRTDGLVLTEAGHEVLADLGVDIPDHSRRAPLKECLDWTERREHLSGTVPTALLTRAVQDGWLGRGPNRAVRVHERAEQPLARLGVRLADLAN